MTQGQLTKELLERFGHDMSAGQIESFFRLRHGIVKKHADLIEQITAPGGKRPRFAVNSVAAWYLADRVVGEYR